MSSIRMGIRAKWKKGAHAFEEVHQMHFELRSFDGEPESEKPQRLIEQLMSTQNKNTPTELGRPCKVSGNNRHLVCPPNCARNSNCEIC